MKPSVKERLQTVSNLVWGHSRTPPVVEVILQVPISHSKLELLQELLVIHKIKSIEYIKTHL